MGSERLVQVILLRRDELWAGCFLCLARAQPECVSSFPTTFTWAINVVSLVSEALCLISAVGERLEEGGSLVRVLAVKAVLKLGTRYGCN